MSISAIAPSPVARLLLELESRRATAGIDLGGRRVVLARGAIVDVRPYAGDPTLGSFLVAAGRIDDGELAALSHEAAARGVQLETVLRDRDVLDADGLSEVRRALWLDRFVRGLSSDEARGAAPSAVTPEASPPSGAGYAALPFVLDALARRASLARDAELVGELADALFEWRDGPDAPRAKLWAELGHDSVPVAVSQLLVRHPAAPSRIAALVRAGLGRLAEREAQVPAPETRPPAIVAPVHDPRTVEHGAEARQPEPMPPSAGDTREGQARPLGIPKLASWLPKADATLDDPLDALERRIAQLEQSGAPAEDRARAWLELGDAHRFHYDSLDECARVSREAAAADPSNVDALESAATLSAATGRPGHAYQYARALAEALAADPHARAAALVRAYHYGKRAQLDSNALSALREAHGATPDHPAIAELLARALLADGELAEGVAAAQAAIRTLLAERPEQGLFLSWWLSEAAPAEPSVSQGLVEALAHTGRHEASLAVAAEAARGAGADAAVAQGLAAAAQRAESAGRPDLALDALLEAIERPAADRAALWDPILRSAAALGSAADLAVLACAASLEGEAALSADRLRLAADARQLLPGDASLAAELYTAALEHAPTHAGARAALAQLARSEGQRRVLHDALERALARHRDDATVVGLLTRELAALALRADDCAPLLARRVLREYPQAPRELADELARAEALGAPEDQALTELEQEVRAAAPKDRADALVALAVRLRDDPARRGRARKFLEYVLDKRPEHGEARAHLEALLRLTGDRPALHALWAARAEAGDPAARTSALLKRAYDALLSREAGEVAELARAALAITPRQREAMALLAHVTAGDPLARREALERRLEVGLEPRERGRTAVALAHAARARGDEPAAARLAELALTLDPRSGDAALLVRALHTAIEPTRRAGLLRVAHAVLGAGPSLMRALGQACFATGDAHGQRSALETYARYSPHDALPALGLCALTATGHDARALTEAIRLAIDPARIAEGTADAVRAAFTRLWMLGPMREVTGLLLDAADALGEHGTPLLGWALPFVREAADPRLVRAVLERLVARVRGEARRAELRRLAHFCRDQGMRAAEARAYLRLLAVEPSDDEALGRLAAIYAETREVERLMAVLTVRLNGARDADERLSRLFALALTSLDLADDAPAAVGLLRAALAPQPGPDGGVVDCPLPALRRGIGMLLGAGAVREAFDLLLELSADASPERAQQLVAEAVVVAEEDLGDADLSVRTAMLGLETFPDHTAFLEHVERVAPALGNFTALRDTYRTLADAVPDLDRKKALLARGVFMLERTGALDDAVDMAERVLVLEPTDDLALAHLERLARQSGRPEPLIRALVARGASAPDAATRAERLAQAARLADDDAHDPVRAAELYVQAYGALPSEPYEALAMACLIRLAERDATAADKPAQALRDALTREAKDIGARAGRVRSLTALAELALDVQHQDDDAVSYAVAARGVLEQLSELDGDARDVLRQRVETVLARTRKEPRHGSVPGSAARGSEPSRTPSAPTALVARPRRPSELERERDDKDLRRLSVTPHGGLAAGRIDGERGRPALRVEVLGAEDEGLVRGVMLGSAAALERLLATRDGNFGRAAALCEALLSAVRLDGPNLSALRGLQALAEHLRRRDLAAVVGEAFAHFDPHVSVRAAPRLPAPSDEATRGALAEARDDGALAPAFAVLYHVYTAATPLFRRPLASYGVSAGDFVGHGEYGARGDARDDVTRVLGLEYETYVATSGRATIDVAATQPASIIIGGEVPADRYALRFRLGAAFERARPQNALIATHAEAEAEVLVAAIIAAFGSSGCEPSEVPREPAALAAELWRTMPGQAQRQVEQTLRGLPQALDARALRDQLARRAARVGLVVTGSLTVALEQLGCDDSPRPARVPSTEAAFADALTQRPDVRDMVTFALSDAYLALRSRESS